ncbi:Thiamine-monophosphate kinase (TMP kinase) (Thiamine-phosphate kinase), partial [Durusdinium trenchii]
MFRGSPPAWNALPLTLVNGRRPSEQRPGQLCFGYWGTDIREEIVFCRTNSDRAEVHCHGGEAAVRRILADCQSEGAEVVSWRDLAGPTLAAECWEKVIEATTERTAHWLVAQASVFPQAVRRLPTLSPQKRSDAIREMINWAPFGLHQTRLADIRLPAQHHSPGRGQMNVGKSSLMNALLGYGRAIVFDQPGTTRDVVESETAIAGWPFLCSDTAGLRESDDELESAGIDRALASAAKADLCLLVIDAGTPASQVDKALEERLDAPLVVLNKIDRPIHPDHQNLPSSVRVSALTREGIETLQNEIVRRLVPRTPPDGRSSAMTAPDEFSFIEKLRRRANVLPAVHLGIGDDAAWLASSPHGQLVAVDMLAEGRHFTFPEATPELVGRKALAVNLSDLAAMGGRPTSAFVSLMLPADRGSAFADRVMTGLLELAAEFQVTVAGGDTNSWAGPLVISVTVCGEPLDSRPILRRGACADDWLMVSGPLGGSFPSGRHLTFEPRVELAAYLVEHVQVHAMIDLSDGLGSDLRHLLDASEVGAILKADSIPIHED